MANQIPLSGITPAAGGFLLPDAQGDLLTNGLLREAGAIALAGDARATASRREVFPIWLGLPTADFVGEGARKPVTGAEFAQTQLNVKKVASIVMFTDEMLEDVQSGDLNVLVDSGVREAIADVTDAHAIGLDSGAAIVGAFDTELVGTTQAVEWVQATADGLERAISAAMGLLEANGYGNPGSLGVLMGTGFAQQLRDARSALDTTQRIYDGARDPLYGLARFTSTNLSNASAAVGANNVVAIVAHRPNIHVRIRKDIAVSSSTEATIDVLGTPRYLFQENLTAIRYEMRMAFMVHDLNRAVVKITNTA